LIFKAFGHPFFVSMTEMIFNPKEKSLEISVRIFTDDLEKELSKTCQCKVNLGLDENKTVNTKLLDAYFQNFLKVKIQNQAQKLIWHGYQNEEESTWSFLEIKTEAVENLAIENRILHQSQEKQINFMRLKKPGFDKTVQLAFPEVEARF
jgi:hypothetical protein